MKKILLSFIFCAGAIIASAQGFHGNTTSKVNLRSGPGTEYEILASLPAYTQLYVFAGEKEGDFYHVHCVDLNIDGYIHSKYVKLGKFIPLQEESPFQSDYTGSGLNPEVIITNDTKLTLTLKLDTEFYTFAPKETKTITIHSGNHKYFASAKGVLPCSGVEDFEASHTYTWRFYITTTYR